MTVGGQDARSEFSVEHRITVRSVCPVDGSEDVYNCIVALDRVVPVEEIIAAVEAETREPRFQEDITRSLAKRLDGEVVTHGIHSGVYTTCRFSA